MIVEERIYTLQIGKVPEYLKLYAAEGFAVQTRILGNLLGYYQVEFGPQNQIALAQPGATTWVRSWVPSCETTGMVIRHGEAFTLSDHLTVWDGSKAIYRPTVH